MVTCNGEHMQIIRAHLIPETVNFFDLRQRTETGLNVTLISLQGLPWTFSWQFDVEKTVGSLVLVDLYLVTQGKGYFDIQADISNTDQAKWYAHLPCSPAATLLFVCLCF